MKPWGKRAWIERKMTFWENSKKRIQKKFSKKKLNFGKISKMWSNKKISMFKKNFKNKNFCFKKHKKWYCETRNQYFFKIFAENESWDHAWSTCWISKKWQKSSNGAVFTYRLHVCACVVCRLCQYVRVPRVCLCCCVMCVVVCAVRLCVFMRVLASLSVHVSCHLSNQVF